MTDKPDRRALKTMDADGYRRALEYFELSQVGAARFLEVNEKTSRDWAAANQADGPPATVAKFLRTIAALGLSLTEVEEAIRIWSGNHPDAF